MLPKNVLNFFYKGKKYKGPGRKIKIKKIMLDFIVYVGYKLW